MTMIALDRYQKSRELFEQAQNYLPGGNSRLTVYHKPHPIYMKKGRGCRIWDVDGNQYIDFINNYTSLIHGHIHPEIEATVVAALHNGTAFAGTTEAELNLAKLLCDRLPHVDQLRFTNSGTEAVMTAIKAARAYTGKPAIAKIEGAYHGTYDFAEISQASAPHNWGELEHPNSTAYSKGTPQTVLDGVVVLPFNFIDETVALLRQNQDRLAAVLLDPMPSRLGLLEPKAEYLQALQAECRKLGILLILDEVINFRLDYNGAQTVFNLEPDLTTLAKIIGGGFPVGAIGGKREVMSVFTPLDFKKPPLPHAGTYNANPITMTAGLQAMKMLTPSAFDYINGLSDLIRKGLREMIARNGFAWQVTGRGSLFQFHPHTDPLIDYRSSNPSAEQAAKLGKFHRGMLDRGVFLGLPSFGCVSTVMTTAEVDELIAKAEETLREG
jgi:glutamate-1-semialdehyde 2,1-aminomutase